MYANNHSHTNDERSQLVLSCLKVEALELYLKEINSQMPYQMVVDKLACKIQHVTKKFVSPIGSRLSKL